MYLTMFQDAVNKTLELYNQCLQYYNDSMRELTNAVEYINADYFEKIHNKTKNEAIEKVWPRHFDQFFLALF